MIKLLKYIISLTLIFTSIVNADDIKGSKDPNGLLRYQGSSIVRYESLNFEQYVYPLGKLLTYDFTTKKYTYDKSGEIEGKLQRLTYHISDPNVSSLEVFRNYQEQLLKDGWETLFKASGKTEYGNLYTRVYESLKDNDQLLTYNDQAGHLLVAKNPKDESILTLFVTKFENGLTRGIKVSKGDPLVQLDIVYPKLMDKKMELVTSTEMSNSINQVGKVSLYGIYFDFNQYTIKSESDESINEISKLLKENPSLKVLLVGHTDNIGNFDTNKDLSQKRAEEVVKMLISKYSISRDRLKAFGASYASPVTTNETEEGRAKNRRVELVKFN